MISRIEITARYLCITLALLITSSIVLINNFSPYIPDYDGLSYFEHSRIYKNWLFEGGDLRFFRKIGREFVNYWPITNGPSVLIAAIFGKTIDLNLIPIFANSIYLILFTLYVSKIRSNQYACIAILLLCANAFFYRLFTTLTSEFSVGLWIFAYLLTLTTKHQYRWLYLCIVISVGLVLRTIDIVFVLSAASAYAFVQFFLFSDKHRAIETGRYVALSIFLTAPLLSKHYQNAWDYVMESQTGVSSIAWKEMAGVYGGFDVPLKYAEYLTLYNPAVIAITLAVVTLSLLYYRHTRNELFTNTALSFSIALPLLMASTINIQTTFWIFSALIFTITELGSLILKLIPSNYLTQRITPVRLSYIGTSAVIIYCMISLTMSWAIEVKFLKTQKSVSEIAIEISEVLDKVPQEKHITGNYRGVGALDNLGLSWGRKHKIIEGSVRDIYSKNLSVDSYLAFDPRVTFFIGARQNYFFPSHFGINEHIVELYSLFNQKSKELGFKKISEISRDNNHFDIWYKPSALLHLQYLNYNDKWMGESISIDIGSINLCGNEKVSGNLKISALFPNPGVAEFTPPFLVTMTKSSTDTLISSTNINQFGESDIDINIQDLDCGQYEIHFHKTFQTKNDPRKLSAHFIKLVSDIKFTTIDSLKPNS